MAFPSMTSEFDLRRGLSDLRGNSDDCPAIKQHPLSKTAMKLPRDCPKRIVF